VEAFLVLDPDRIDKWVKMVEKHLQKLLPDILMIKILVIFGMSIYGFKKNYWKGTHD